MKQFQESHTHFQYFIQIKQPFHIIETGLDCSIKIVVNRALDGKMHR